MWTKNVDEEHGKRANISICRLRPGSSISIYASGNNYLHFFKHTQRKTHTTDLRQVREELLHLLVRWTLVGGWTDGQGRRLAAAAATAPSQPSASGRTKKRGSSVGNRGDEMPGGVLTRVRHISRRGEGFFSRS